MTKQRKAKEGMPSTQPFVYQLTVSENNTQIRSIVIPWNTTMTMAQNIVLKLQHLSDGCWLLLSGPPIRNLPIGAYHYFIGFKLDECE